MKIAIIINEKRATPDLIEKLKDVSLAEKYNITYDIFVKKPQEIDTFIRVLNHESYNACIVGGGDGSVRTVAQALVSKDIPLAILPLGTFNFLAKTLNYPNDIDALFSMIANNKTRQIDLGDINNVIFINHAWIGFYYNLIKAREKYANFLGSNRLLKIIFNTLNFFKVLPIYDLELKVDGKVVQCKTCLIYIGNNDQYTNILDFGERKSLSSGLLSVYVLNCTTRWELFKCMLTIFYKKLKDSQYVTQFTTDNLIIKSKHKIVKTVIDGELMQFESPLIYTVQKNQLKVFVP